MAPGAERLTNVAQPPSMAWGTGAYGGPGGHDQVAGAPIQAWAAQASWGEGSEARPWASCMRHEGDQRHEGDPGRVRGRGHPMEGS